MLLRIVVIFLLSTICSAAMGFTSRTESQIEDVALHDGRHIKVERTVQWKTEFHILDPFFGLPIMPRFETSGPDTFRIKFKHPDTQEIIAWQGVQHYTPVLLDIVSGVPYLVVNGFTSKKTEAIYGCPELPYFYLKYESGFFGKWVALPVEKAPEVLRESNLSQASRNDGGFFQRVIPRTYEEWNYLYKNSHRNEREFGDCRPPRIQLPPVILPAAMEGSPELLDTVNYAQERVFIGDEWGRLTFDQKREGECKKLFRPAALDDYMQDQRFINDSTGKKPVPYSKNGQFQMGTRMLCDEYIWFITHQEEPGKMIITKFTISGDLALRVSFLKPEPIQGFVGYISIPSLRSEAGYLYFDWMDFRDINREWHVKRILKMRMRIPAVAAH